MLANHLPRFSIRQIVLRGLAPALGLLAGLAAAGCDAGADDPARLNQVIGDTTPAGGTAVDLGILKDQTAYQPAPFDGGPAAPAGGGDDAASGGGDSADSPEAAEVRQAADQILGALINIDVDEILNAFEPAAVAPLREGDFVSSAKELVAALSRTFEASRTKAPESAEINASAWELVPLFKGLVVEAFEVQVSGETAELRLPPAALKREAEERRETVVAALDKVLSQLPPEARQQIQMQMGATELPTGAQAFDQMIEALTAAEAQAGEAPESLPLRKVEERWRLAIPFQITADQAAALTDALAQVTPLVNDLTARIEAAESLTPEASQELTQAWFSQNQFQFIALFGQLTSAFAVAEAPPADTPEGEAAGEDGGDDAAAAPNPTETAGDGAGTASDAPSLTTQVQPILTSRCLGCHKPNTPAWVNTKLNLGDGIARGALLNQPSAQDESLILIVPGDPGASYLMQKLESDSPAFGRQMPPRDGPLSAEEIDIIRRWIAAGCPEN